MWLDRPDTRHAVVRLAERVGKATPLDRRNAMRVFRFLANEENVLNVPPVDLRAGQCARGAVMAHSDADWAG